MKKHPEGPRPVIRLFLLLGLVPVFFPACCPSGTYDDNFGRSYSLVTVPIEAFEEPFLTSGSVDTRDMGCGVWSIRPPAEGEPPVDPNYPVAWVAVNPNPNPADQCCYAFRFDGKVTGSGCSVIIGTYRNTGGKCEGSGAMYLVSAQ